jgi:hypothetical protein
MPAATLAQVRPRRSCRTELAGSYTGAVQGTGGVEP